MAPEEPPELDMRSSIGASELQRRPLKLPAAPWRLPRGALRSPGELLEASWVPQGAPQRGQMSLSSAFAHEFLQDANLKQARALEDLLGDPQAPFLIILVVSTLINGEALLFPPLSFNTNVYRAIFQKMVQT